MIHIYIIKIFMVGNYIDLNWKKIANEILDVE